MAKEIERKFLVPKFNPKDFSIIQQVEIHQQYLMDSDPELRIRSVDVLLDTEEEFNKGSHYYFTFKSDGKLSRREQEFMITEKEFRNLKAKLPNPNQGIHKMRYVLRDDGKLIAVDVFEGNLKGLVTAEVEFCSQEDAKDYIQPDWFGEEITYQIQYYNKNLARLSSVNF